MSPSYYNTVIAMLSLLCGGVAGVAIFYRQVVLKPELYRKDGSPIYTPAVVCESKEIKCTQAREKAEAAQVKTMDKILANTECLKKSVAGLEISVAVLTEHQTATDRRINELTSWNRKTMT